MPVEPWWETNPARTPRQELGMVSPELRKTGKLFTSRSQGAVAAVNTSCVPVSVR